MWRQTTIDVNLFFGRQTKFGRSKTFVDVQKNCLGVQKLFWTLGKKIETTSDSKMAASNVCFRLCCSYIRTHLMHAKKLFCEKRYFQKTFQKYKKKFLKKLFKKIIPA